MLSSAHAYRLLVKPAASSCLQPVADKSDVPACNACDLGNGGVEAILQPGCEGVPAPAANLLLQVHSAASQCMTNRSNQIV